MNPRCSLKSPNTNNAKNLFNISKDGYSQGQVNKKKTSFASSTISTQISRGVLPDYDLEKADRESVIKRIQNKCHFLGRLKAFNAISKDRMKNSCRARRYVCSYYVMYHGLDKTENEVVNAVEEVPEVDANNSRNCAAVDVGSLKRKSVSSSMTCTYD